MQTDMRTRIGLAPLPGSQGDLETQSLRQPQFQVSVQLAVRDSFHLEAGGDRQRKNNEVPETRKRYKQITS